MKKLGYCAIIILAVLTIPEVYAELGCEEEYSLSNQYQYKIITPLEHSITNGEFLQFCAEPNYLWYKIYLDAQESGSLTITIPKNNIDLKHFDYESCSNIRSLTTNIDSFKSLASVTQISQTDESRTLEFTWLEPITYIEYFGTFAIIDDVDYSEPNWCIGLVESGQKSAEIHLPTLNEIYDTRCLGREIMLNYTLGSGEIKRFCNFNISEFLIETQNVTSDTVFTIDVPYTVLPLVTKENTQNFFILLDGWELYQNIDDLVTHQYSNYQTFEFNLSANAQYSRFEIASPISGDTAFDHDYNLTIPLLEFEDQKTISKINVENSSCKSNFVSLMKYDKSKTVCVKPTSADKLIMRGWGFLNI